MTSTGPGWTSKDLGWASWVRLDGSKINLHGSRLSLYGPRVSLQGSKTDLHGGSIINLSYAGTYLSYAAPWAKLHSSDLYAAPFWSTLHPIWTWLRPKSYASPSEQLELSCNLLSFAVPFWATLDPTELRLTLNELCGTLKKYCPCASQLRWSLRQNLSYICLVYHSLSYSCLSQFRKDLEIIPRVCFYFCSTERNSEMFSLLRKGSERNSENFFFRGTAGIPSEITICSVYSVFRGIIFFVGNSQPWSQFGRLERSLAPCLLCDLC